MKPDLGGEPESPERGFQRRLHVTPREDEILRLASQDLTVKQVARELKLAPRTVRSHLENFYRRNGVHTKSGAVALWLRAANR